MANDVVQYDMDTSAVGDPVGLISGINIVKIPCSAQVSKRLSEAAENLQIPVVRGTVASGETFVASREKKEKIAETFDAVACEMEGGDYEAFKHAAAENSTAVLSAFFRGLD